MLRCLLITLFTLVAIDASASDGIASYLPKTDIEHFIVNELDISTFPSSIRPRLGSQHHFKEIGVAITSIKPNDIELSDFWSGWLYSIKILGRGDFNGDGIEDVAVCFIDNGHPTGGSYYATEPLLLTRLSTDGPLVATALKPIDMRCKVSAQ